MEIKLVNLGDGFTAPIPGSSDFEVISNTISDSFGPVLNKLPGYYQIRLVELQKCVIILSALSYLVRYISLILNILFNVLFITSRDDEQNGIIAHMDLILDKNEIKGRSLKPIDTSAAAEKALKEALITGKVGALSVDPQYLFIRAPRGK